MFAKIGGDVENCFPKIDMKTLPKCENDTLEKTNYCLHGLFDKL